MTMSLSDNSSQVAIRDPKTGQLYPGVKLNPAGRPKGSRNKLGEDFIAALADHWAENGKAALDGCLEESPAAYCRVIAAIIPKELHVKTSDAFDGLNDEEIAALVAVARTAIVAYSSRRIEAEAEAGGE